MKLKEFRERFVIDRKAAGVRAVPKGVPEEKIRRHKYGAKRTEVDGIKFPSTHEAKVYQKLLMLERAGLISELLVNAGRSGKDKIRYSLPGDVVYEPDFQYQDHETGEYVVADAKGVRTPAYRIKKKQMKAVFRIEIKEF